MRKKFVKVMLFGVLALSTATSFVGCKDYDDDIKNLQGQIDGKVTPEQLQEKINAMQTALNDAKSDAAAAKTAAETALAEAKAAKDTAAEAKAAVALAAAEAKEAAIKAVAEEVAKLKPEIERMVNDALAGKADAAALASLAERVLKLESEVSAIVGHRLTSIAFIPEANVNGIPAIKFYSLSYVAQTFVNHGVGESTTTGSGDAIVLDNEETVVRYRLNPRMGVRPQDIGMPSFESIVSTNEIETVTRGVNDKLAGYNTPIAPVKGQTITITDNGVLELKVTKTVTDNINREWLAEGKTEKFYMASLNVPIAKENWVAGETAANAPTVHSEYVRISESTVTPMLKQTGSLPVANHPLNGVDANGKYIHYHDSTALYDSKINELIDHSVKWNEPFDLKKLAEVCIVEDNHKTLENHKSYGLSFRFALAKAAYMQGNNNTDQQQFASIDSPMNGMLTSKTYTIGGAAQTALGREPIVRAMLVDTVNGRLVSQRYIKLKFVNKTEETTLPVYDFKNNVLTCLDAVNVFGTQEMNELIYRQLNSANGGMSKKEFHTIYTSMEMLSVTKDGVEIMKAPLTTTTSEAAEANSDIAFVLVKDELDNESYNLRWKMSVDAIGKIVPAKSSTYVIKIAFKDADGIHGDVIKTFRVVVDVPAQDFKYQGTYWQTGQIGKVFNVNPIVYNPATDGTIGTTGDHSGHSLTDYSHIEADLVNGFVYGATSQKPANLAQFIQYIRNCAEVKFEFASDKFGNGNYPHLNGYVTNTAKTELWKTTVGTIVPGYIQTSNAAASIASKFGATNLENKKNLPWDKDEELGSGVNEAMAQIRLFESTQLLGTPAAQALVGKKVPVRLVVKYNKHNPASVQEFDVFFINPLTVDAKIGNSVTDAVIGGSFVNVEEGFTFTDWNNYAVAKVNKTGEKGQYAHALWHYYGVSNIVFDTDNVHTNFAWNADKTALVPTENVTDGPLPAGRSLSPFAADKVTASPNNPVYLGYFNNDGTPVNLDYKMFIDVKVGYKWGTVTKKDLQLDVQRAGGTPTRR